jgi:hypothetical protein
MHASHSRSSSAHNAQDDRGSPLPGTCSPTRRGARTASEGCITKGTLKQPTAPPSGGPGRGLPANVYVNAWCTRQDPGTQNIVRTQAPCPPDPARRRRHWLSAIARRGADRAAPATPSVHPLGGTGRAHLGIASCAISAVRSARRCRRAQKPPAGAISPQAKRVKKQQHDIPPSCTGRREKTNK